jgi:hypothetical protein
MSTFSELIDFTRSSTGTYLDSVVYGEEALTGNWATAPSYNNVTTGTGTSVVSVLTGAGQNRCYLPIDNVEQGKSYITTITVDPASTASFGYYVRDGSNPNSGDLLISQTVVSGEAYTLFCTAVSDDMNVLLVGTSNSTMSATISVKEVTSTAGGTPLLRTADTNEPRLEYDASGQPLGLLIEEQRTNKVPYSQDFTNDNHWSKQEVTVAAAPVAAPDGTMTATHVVKTGEAGHLVDTNIVTTSDRNSIWARSVSGTGTIYIAFHDANSLITLTEEWQRFDVQCNNNHVYAVNFRGSATLTECYIWGSQAETGTFPTSYIPTSGSTVTRNKDVCKVTAFKYHQNDQQGTLFVEGTPNISQAQYRRFAEFEYSNLRFSIQTINGTIASYTRNAANSTNNSIGTASPYTPYRTQKSAFTVSAGYAAKSNNGLEAQSETDVLGLDEPNVDLYIGQQDNASDQLCGHIKRVLYFPTKLSNDELVELTKPSSSPTMSLTFDGQATSELVEGLHD